MTEIQKRFITGLEKSGRITAPAVLDAARPASSPIHDCFDWYDSEAAEKWRLEQARELIRRVKIELVYQEVSVRTVKYVADPARSDGYTDIVKARAPSLAEIMSAEWRNVLARIIPTCVGKSALRSLVIQTTSDHPHVRGEKSNILC